MSKDKGTKNHKKSPADRTKGNPKPGSAYKNEGKSASPTLSAFMPKPEVKPEKPAKS
jgi:hypothetical protein